MGRGRTSRKRLRRQVSNDRHARGTPAQDSSWTALRGWCKAQGMPRGKLNVAFFPDTFRGMMATKDIHPGDDLVRVPERLLITASKVRQSMLPGIAGAGISEHQALTYWVYVEASSVKNSVWATYIKALPRGFGSIPLYVLSGNSPSSELSAVTDAQRWVLRHLPYHIKQKVSEQQVRLFSDWARTQDIAAKAGRAPLGDWRHYVWAWLVVNTRCIHLGQQPVVGHQQSHCKQGPSLGILQPISSQDGIALAPVLDLLNHSPSAEIKTCFEQRTREFAIQACRGYRKGQEAFIPYGPHDNAFMLAEYGFVAPHNPYRALDLDQDMCTYAARVESTLRSSKAKLATPSNTAGLLVGILRQHRLWGGFALQPNDPEPYKLLAALHLLLAAEQQGPLGLKRIVQQWERWLRGDQASEKYSVVGAAVQQWIKRICRETVELSRQMASSIRAIDPGTRKHLDPFLIHCLCEIWEEMGRTAASNCN